MVSWVKGYNPELIAQQMEKTKSVSGNSKVSFSGFEHSEHVVLLNSMICVKEEIPEVEKRRIINQATFNAGEKGVITQKSILREVGKLENEFLNKEEKKYRLVTSISVSRTCPFPKVRIDGSSIVIHPRLNKTTVENRIKLMKEARHSIISNPPNNYADVSVSVSARTTAEAAEKALERVDYVRGIWNLWKNRGYGMRRSSGQRNPVNTILLGPIHTLHNDNGSLATESWWYEPQYQGPVDLFRDSAKAEKMVEFMGKFRDLLNKSHYKDEIIQAVVRYVRSMDSRDWDDAYLRLWGVLELLTGTVSESYAVTVRRASYMFSDKEYAYQVLTHLRDYRNKSVHVGSDSGDIEALMYQLKRYVEVLIEFHVANKYRFTSIADAAEFMDMPNDKSLIDAKISKLQHAKEFLGG